MDFYGWRHPIIVSNQSGLIVAGHGRLEAAKKLGREKVPVHFQEFQNEEEELGFLTSDNAIASWAELDLGTINAFVPDLGPDFDLDLLGIKDFTLDASDKFEGDEDAVPETPIEPKVKRGELWILGSHRLLIDDCTVKENVERLMGGEKADMVFTDPPYGMNLDTDYSGHSNSDGRHSTKKLNAPSTIYKPVIGDDLDFDAKAILNHFEYCAEVFLFGADYYRNTIPKGGSWVVWDKRTPRASDVNFDAVPGSCFELCWSKAGHKRDIARILHCGLYSVENDKRQHPTQKPVQLAEWFFERWGKDAKNIWDGYLGSGSTLIACEKTNRKCFGCEIDPHYGQVIIERWQKFTGREAVREDGTKYSDL